MHSVIRILMIKVQVIGMPLSYKRSDICTLIDLLHPFRTHSFCASLLFCHRLMHKNNVARFNFNSVSIEVFANMIHYQDHHYGQHTLQFDS